MLTILNFEGKVRLMSDEVYEITQDTSSPNYPAGTLVRLISGVDDSDQPGYHFDPMYKTVCRLDATIAQGVGVPRKNLKRVS